MKVKTSNLTGSALNWAVAKAEGLRVNDDGSMKYWKYFPGYGDDDFDIPAYTTDWSQGGPLIEREHISTTQDHSGLWLAYIGWNYADSKDHMQADRSLLVAAMRCFVVSKLGDEVDVPKELLS
jgi:hypothetical protein